MKNNGHPNFLCNEIWRCKIASEQWVSMGVQIFFQIFSDGVKWLRFHDSISAEVFYLGLFDNSADWGLAMVKGKKNKKGKKDMELIPKVPSQPASSPGQEKTARQETSPYEDSPYTITVRYQNGDGISDIRLSTNDGEFYPVARQWSYVVANRRRITPETRATLSQDIFDRVRMLTNISQDELKNKIKTMAASKYMEVEIPYEREGKGWAARIFPWENIIGLLTKPYRDTSGSYTVLRNLAPSAERRPVSALSMGVLIVRSGPGELLEKYDLNRECRMVQEALQELTKPPEDPVLTEPNRTTLLARLQEKAPAVVHLAGVDPVALGGLTFSRVETEHEDGFVLRGKQTTYDCVEPADFGVLLGSAPSCPHLVSVSSCFSAMRMAPMAVANGARHAIGFQDTITDADALLFFSSFYRAWVKSWDILHAFQNARIEFSRQASAQANAGVVLWSDHSWLIRPPEAKPLERKTKTVSIAVPTAKPSDLKLYIEALPNLNYSLLHNDRSPFKNFMVDKPLPGPLPPLRIEVALEVGGEMCRSRFAEPLPAETGPLKLEDKIRLPLVAGLLRQCSESLRTNLYVRVECGDELLKELSERVTIQPADEWRDDGEDHRWLPCFVLPRDPAVLKVISAAQRYLRTLLDDTSAGFDGYQRLAVDDSNAADIVDPQVQAIWAALQHDLPLSYINPPPSYTSQSQRLRSPSQIFQGGAATCIDLALLFASCLEFVGIYPVIFLITGHAFPGYWRSDKAWWQLRKFGHKDSLATPLPIQAPTPPATSNPRGQEEGWMFEGIENLGELLRYVQAGTLVPFESTYVTQHRGFFESLEMGSSQLRPETFDAMIEILLARDQKVTPIPLMGANQ
jgi:hypothetical protein